MFQLVFEEKLHTGHQDVDEQHRMMFSWAHRTLNRGDMKDREILEAIRFLLAYIHFHFQSEERLMEKTDYPKMKHHVQQHQNIRQEVVAIRDAAMASEKRDKILSRVHVLFQDWFTFHIKEVDTPLAAYVREKARQADLPLATSSQLVEEGRLDPEYAGIEDRWNPNPELADGIAIKAN